MHRIAGAAWHSMVQYGRVRYNSTDVYSTPTDYACIHPISHPVSLRFASPTTSSAISRIVSSSSRSPYLIAPASHATDWLLRTADEMEAKGARPFHTDPAGAEAPPGFSHLGRSACRSPPRSAPPGYSSRTEEVLLVAIRPCFT
ncbi:hypothetical protein V494_07886, partial [Pseudogymnoascus sp. VKM F-4513 (FW-928)]